MSYLHLENARLSADDAMRLENLLAKVGDDFSVELMDGFFTALLIGPKAMQLGDMQKLMSDALRKGQASAAESAQLEQDLAHLWSTRQQQLLGDHTLAETIWLPLLRDRAEAQDNSLVAKKWAEGFLLATNIHADHWRAAAEQVEAIDDCATLLSALVNNEGDEGQLSKEIRQHLIDSLAVAIQSMEQYWRPWRSQMTIVKPQKTGRNDPCPCGSGKKYKKCCGADAVH